MICRIRCMVVEEATRLLLGEEEECSLGLNHCFRVCKGEDAPRVCLVVASLLLEAMQGDRSQVAQICWAKTVNSCWVEEEALYHLVALAVNRTFWPLLLQICLNRWMLLVFVRVGKMEVYPKIQPSHQWLMEWTTSCWLRWSSSNSSSRLKIRIPLPSLIFSL